LTVIQTLMSNLKIWSQDRAVVIISHDMEVIRWVDTIYRLEHGKIVNHGSTQDYCHERA
jgi:ABC-type bacteriocin/lantibiotic exporter with double-glycine peptidase domain